MGICTFWVLGTFADMCSRQPHAELVGAHINVSNCFWSMVLRERYWSTFRVMADGELWAFKSLPFGWSYSPVICWAVLEHIVWSVVVDDVFVLIHYDDIFVIGHGKDHAGNQSEALAVALNEAGAPVSPKSTPEPRPHIRWIGNEFDFAMPVIYSDSGARHAFWTRWLQLSVFFCAAKRLLWGAFIGTGGHVGVFTLLWPHPGHT